MRLALDDAGIEPGDVVHVNADGTSTPLNDAAEAAAITALFGSRARGDPRSRGWWDTLSAPPAPWRQRRLL